MTNLEVIVIVLLMHYCFYLGWFFPYCSKEWKWKKK